MTVPRSGKNTSRKGMRSCGAEKRPGTSLERALAIFELAAQRSGGITNAELARKLQIPTSSCSYVLGRLERAGYLRRSQEDRAYELGLRILDLAHSFLYATGLRTLAAPILHDLSTKTGQSVLVAILNDGFVTVLSKNEQPDILDVDFEVGSRHPAHATAIGKMLLSSLSDDRLECFLLHHSLTKRSPRTIDSKDRLMEEIDHIRRRGYSTSNGELIAHIRGLAAPIRGSCGEVCAGLTLCGPALYLEDSHAIRAMESAATLISRRLQDTALERGRMYDPIMTLSNAFLD